MSVAYITSTVTQPISVGPGALRRAPFSTLVRNDETLVVDFQPSTGGVNPNTFSLGAGTYDVKAFVRSLFPPAGGSIGFSDVVVLYDETAGAQIASSNPLALIYDLVGLSGPGFADNETPTMVLDARFTIDSGVHVFSLRLGIFFTITTGGAYGLSPDAPVTALLGGSQITRPTVHLKIIKR